MGNGNSKGKRKGKGNGHAGGAAPGSPHLSKLQYLAELEPLELALNNLARWLQRTGRRLVVVFEGRDLWGPQADPGLQVSVDAWEPYLDAAPA